MSGFRLLPALIVGAAALVMVLLGVWQLRRAEEKALLLAMIERNVAAPAMAFPEGYVANRSALLFRKASALCSNPERQPAVGGIGPGAKAGWRHIVRCGTGAEGPGILVDIGWSPRFDAPWQWAGGPVSGTIAEMPQQASVAERLFRAPPPPELVLIAARPVPPLAPTTPPSRADIPDNHRAYAVQWFLFAALSLLIYILAARRARR